MCNALLAERANLSIYDPRVAAEAIGIALKRDDGAEELLHVEGSALAACTGAHAIIVLTEWDEFTRLDFGALYATMQKPAFVFDGRNLLDHARLREIGFIVHGIGVPPPRPSPPTGEAAQLAMSADLAARARLRVGGAPLGEGDQSPLSPAYAGRVTLD